MPSYTNQRELIRLWLAGENLPMQKGNLSTLSVIASGDSGDIAARIDPTDNHGRFVVMRHPAELTSLSTNYATKITEEAERAAIPVVIAEDTRFRSTLRSSGGPGTHEWPTAFLDLLISMSTEQALEKLGNTKDYAEVFANSGQGDSYYRENAGGYLRQYDKLARSVRALCIASARPEPAVTRFIGITIETIVADIAGFASSIEEIRSQAEQAFAEAFGDRSDAWAAGQMDDLPSFARMTTMARVRLRPTRPILVESSSGAFSFHCDEVRRVGAALLRSIAAGDNVGLAGSNLAGLSISVTPEGDVMIGRARIPGKDLERVAVQAGTRVPVGHTFRFLGQAS